jgi:hypothetical protein
MRSLERKAPIVISTVCSHYSKRLRGMPTNDLEIPEMHLSGSFSTNPLQVTPSPHRLNDPMS